MPIWVSLNYFLHSFPWYAFVIFTLLILSLELFSSDIFRVKYSNMLTAWCMSAIESKAIELTYPPHAFLTDKQLARSKLIFYYHILQRLRYQRAYNKRVISTGWENRLLYLVLVDFDSLDLTWRKCFVRSGLLKSTQTNTTARIYTLY